jgi:hypothetical protein
MGSKGVTKKELLVKALTYRVYVIVGELLLASIFYATDQANLFLFILVVNGIKITAYFLFDLAWFSYFRHAPIIRRVARWAQRRFGGTSS